MEGTLSSKNQISIPTKYREALGLKPGDKILMTLYDDHLIVMKRPDSFAKALEGLGKGLYPEGYLEEERGSWD
jgi:AbrB family looped-hinge helix DNA binding protein